MPGGAAILGAVELAVGGEGEEGAVVGVVGGGLDVNGGCAPGSAGGPGIAAGGGGGGGGGLGEEGEGQEGAEEE